MVFALGNRRVIRLARQPMGVRDKLTAHPTEGTSRGRSPQTDPKTSGFSTPWTKLFENPCLLLGATYCGEVAFQADRRRLGILPGTLGQQVILVAIDRTDNGSDEGLGMHDWGDQKPGQYDKAASHPERTHHPRAGHAINLQDRSSGKQAEGCSRLETRRKTGYRDLDHHLTYEGRLPVDHLRAMGIVGEKDRKTPH